MLRPKGTRGHSESREKDIRPRKEEHVLGPGIQVLRDIWRTKSHFPQ